MDQPNNYKLKIDFLISSDKPSTKDPPKKSSPEPITKKCEECNKRRKIFNKTQMICDPCYRAKTVLLSGNKEVDDFIRYTLTNSCERDGRMEFVPPDKFQNVMFVAEGGFSKIFKATWVDGQITVWNDYKQRFNRFGEMTVALKELHNTENINTKELNGLKIFYKFALNWKPDEHVKKYAHANAVHNKNDKTNFCHNLNKYCNVSAYYGITRNPITKNYMIITKYYELGSLSNFINNEFFNISWCYKLGLLHSIISGLKNIHDVNIIHKDYHSGNIFIENDSNVSTTAITGDLGISKSAIESLDDDFYVDEVYGIIPYVAPEIFQRQKYTKASDIYSFGMIMWELMTGRRPFWDKCHDIDLIIEICDGFRPPIVTNAPEGYIELIQRSWHADPNKRPTATELREKIAYFFKKETSPYYDYFSANKITNIINSPEIGPITSYNPGAIYKSRSLSAMIKSAEIIRNSRIQNKRKFDDNQTGINNNDENSKRIKFNKKKIDYTIKEIKFNT